MVIDRNRIKKEYLAGGTLEDISSKHDVKISTIIDILYFDIYLKLIKQGF